MEASFIAIDNRLMAIHAYACTNNKSSNSVLYLLYQQHYMLPTTRSLAGQLMARALIHCPGLRCPIPQMTDEWRIPFEQEKILQTNPDFLIISSSCQADQQLAFNQQPAMQQLDAYKSQKIYLIDKTIQESPTQYIALAYFDLYQALAAAHFL
jgi:iron complex transport system substrate-binding protein